MRFNKSQTTPMFFGLVVILVISVYSIITFFDRSVLGSHFISPLYDLDGNLSVDVENLSEKHPVCDLTVLVDSIELVSGDFRSDLLILPNVSTFSFNFKIGSAKVKLISDTLGIGITTEITVSDTSTLIISLRDSIYLEVHQAKIFWL